MPGSLQDVKRFQELLQRTPDDGPYDYRAMFSDASFSARRASKKRLRLLKRVDAALRPMLRPGERVAFLTSGVGYSFWESYFLGLITIYLNRRAIAVTNERLILIQIDSRQRPKELRSQIALTAVAGIRRTMFGNTVITLKEGKRYVFAYVPRPDRKVLTDLLSQRPPSVTAASFGTLEHLCPHCYQRVAEYPDACPGCSRGFKSAHRAGLLSLLFPGLGDFYLGHRGFGMLEMLVAALIWVGALLPDPQNPATAGGQVLTGAFIFLLFHVPDSIGTRYVGRKGLYPAGARNPSVKGRE